MATHVLLEIILQIPPVNPQTSLRTTLLLRLTGEFLSSVPGYTPDPETIPSLVEWLEELDRGWLAVLRNQAWDPEESEGVDPMFPPDGAHSKSTPITQTDRTRLKSLLLQGAEALEEWMGNMYVE